MGIKENYEVVRSKDKLFGMNIRLHSRSRQRTQPRGKKKHEDI